MKSVTRLSRSLKPENYLIELSLDRDSMTASGQVTITARKLRPSKRITLHAKGLTISKASITRHDKNGEYVVAVSRVNYHERFEELRLHSEDMLYPGKYTIDVAFSSTITEPMDGIYPSTFELDGEKKMLIATQFESHFARSAFPCIDEPDAKATFDLTLSCRMSEHEVMISNTPQIETSLIDGITTTKFITSPMMSTYLLAFVVGRLDYVEKQTKRGTAMRVYFTPQRHGQADFALDVAVKTLEFYESYFRIDYPLDKCDLVALPDFAAGAMENWGCITFREATLLVDSKNTSTQAKQFVAMVVAHELAHQWFGNLVTMSWWTDLWLNEGFAAWIEYLAVDHIFPEWNMWTQFITDDLFTAQTLDSLENSHPVEVSIHNPDEIRTIFDNISYNKGASVIRMLHSFLGAKNFQDGLELYLNKHQYSNTITGDLWDALGEVAKTNVRGFMEPWTSQTGFPVVSIAYTGSTYELTQRRFLVAEPTHNDRSIWPIPITASTGARIFADTTVRYKRDELSLPINKNYDGFFITNYDADLQKVLLSQLRSQQLNFKDALMLLHDSLMLNKGLLRDTTLTLELASAATSYSQAPVWDSISDIFSSIRRVMHDGELTPQLRKFVASSVTSQLERLTLEPKDSEDYFDTLLRRTIVALASFGEITAVISHHQELFSRMEDPEEISPDFRSCVYATVVGHGDKNVFKKLTSLYMLTTSPEEKINIASALASFKQPDIHQEALAFIHSDNVRLQDVGYWISFAFANPYNFTQTWQWMKDEWEWLEDTFINDLAFARLPIFAARAISSEENRGEYEDFFQAKQSPSLRRSIEQGKETMKWQIAWRRKEIQHCLDYLKSTNTKSSTS